MKWIVMREAKRLRLIVCVFFLTITRMHAVIPLPDHVVICMLENHDYSTIIGSANAPYINQLALLSANMTNFYALTHPSQPNYIMLFSGTNQGEVTDASCAGTPWSTPNLGAALIDSGFTFAGYSEDLPVVGSLVAASGAYARKHCPWTNWQGPGLNQLPDSTNLPMTMFPSDFSLLPDLSFVIPNQVNDMHDGSDPARITLADSWIQTHLDSFINWASVNNSLFILTFDEDNGSHQNHIPCLFIGPMVNAGNYPSSYHLYDLLRTLLEMYGLPFFGNSIHAKTITEIWKQDNQGSPSDKQYNPQRTDPEEEKLID
jgi:phosphatidylinositol-3-phosphatase